MPQTWKIEEPPLTVRAVRDRVGDLHVRLNPAQIAERDEGPDRHTHLDRPWFPVFAGMVSSYSRGYSWATALAEEGPLTDATAELPDLGIDYTYEPDPGRPAS